ncbi:electron transfer flavoprotein subunit alpha/FixB family protein [Clostridium cadaveris]|uniref:electron transfer flavoprotein subunit alpha/FixB family protein n=1 Tax=Clostridium cadaveris TaxID=1529 RepID=UPI0039A10F87
MANGICVFAENYNGNLEAVVAELVSAANLIKETTGEKIKALLVAKDCEKIIEQVKQLGIDEIYAVKTEADCSFQDDAVSHVIAEMIRKIEPSSVLIPATTMSRSLFSRVAAKLECGLTADCTELKVDKRENGSFYIKQNKPSFGENIFVTIVTKEGCYPQMMTVRPGVYTEVEKIENNNTEVYYLDDIAMPESKIKFIEALPSANNTDSILSADIVVVGGRGAESEENFELLKKVADKLGAAIGGTRPLADTGFIPFEHQIGQTGYTIRPRICISLGVSGAIQHTEGIKDTKLFIAINKNEEAPIFNISDYGIVGDMKEVLECILEL